MSLEDALKARTLELISQQMANWVVEIQKNIGRHQENLVRTLDELQENVARYDEKLDEGAIARAIVQVIKENPPPTVPKGPGFDPAQALSRLGGHAKGVLAVPLILREKLAAILYCDTAKDEIPPAEADLIEILVVFAGKIIDMLSAVPKTTIAARTTGNMAERAAAIRAGGDEVRERANVPRPPAPPPPPASHGGDEGSSTVMFNASTFASMKQPAPARPAAHPPAAPSGMSPEQQKAHEDAKRFARLVVSEIKLYNEAKVSEGRRQKDLYERLKEDIERGRQMYAERVPGAVRDATNYFYDELVRILAGGDAGALGPM